MASAKINGNHHGTTKNGSASKDKTAELFAKQVFTTGEAAEVCKVSQQTIIRCFDAGRLNGFRVPGSRFRRIPREELIRFMKANDIPTDGFATGKKKVMVVDDDPNIVELFTDLLGRDNRLEIRSAATGYDAGIVSSTFKPDLMILDYMLPDINGNVVCETVRKNDQLKDMKIIIVSGVVNREEIDALLAAGADEFVKKPFDLEKLMGRVEALLEI
ncbi:MAG: response regulator [Planctomycetota bacterium]